MDKALKELHLSSDSSPGMNTAGSHYFSASVIISKVGTVSFQGSENKYPCNFADIKINPISLGGVAGRNCPLDYSSNLTKCLVKVLDWTD